MIVVAAVFVGFVLFVVAAAILLAAVFAVKCKVEFVVVVVVFVVVGVVVVFVVVVVLVVIIVVFMVVVSRGGICGGGVCDGVRGGACDVHGGGWVGGWVDGWWWRRRFVVFRDVCGGGVSGCGGVRGVCVIVPVMVFVVSAW